MHLVSRDRLAGLFPAIKEEWIERLRGEPVLSPLGRPDTLVYLMDATLQQWASGLATADRRTWLRKCPPVAGGAHQHCACGLNPLMKYFTTGTDAIERIAGPVLGAHAEPALAFFRGIARHELETLCSVCLRPGHSGCELPPGRSGS